MSFTEKQLTSIHAATEHLHASRMKLVLDAGKRQGCPEFDELSDEPMPCQREERLIQTSNITSFVTAQLGRALVERKFAEATRLFTKLVQAQLSNQTVCIDHVMQQQADRMEQADEVD